MYIPKHFRIEDREEILTFVQENSFGILISNDGKNSQATHLPFFMWEDGEKLKLISHLAKGNPQWRHLDGQDVLVIFPGPHSYISASWYEEGHETVPTWNYVAVHARGRCHFVESDEEELEWLERFVKPYEKPIAHPWKTEDHEEVVKRMQKGIVSFTIEVTSIEGKAKLSQNHSEERRERVISALENDYDRYDHQAIAERMKGFRKKK